MFSLLAVCPAQSSQYEWFGPYWFSGSGRRWGRWWRPRSGPCRAPSPAGRCPSSSEGTSGRLTETKTSATCCHGDGLGPCCHGDGLGHASLTDVVDGSVVAAQDEEGSGRVVAADGNNILVLQREGRGRGLLPSNQHWTWNCPEPDSTHLPVLGDGVPDTDLPSVAGSDQLVTNKEERLGRNVEAEHACREQHTRLQAVLRFCSDLSRFCSGLIIINKPDPS